MIKSPCYKCPNSGRVHQRCTEYSQYKIEIDILRNKINAIKRQEHDANCVKYDGIERATGKKMFTQR